MKVRRQHYIPAVYLSRFSYDSSPQSRKRSVYAFRRGQTKIIRSKVENLGFINNFYTLTEQALSSKDGVRDPYTIERLWNGIERELTNAMDQLADPNRGTVPADVWVRTLVPFVASMFVRGPSFDKEYQSRSPILDLGREETKGVLSPDNTNMSRLIELQRLLAPVAASRFMVLHAVDGQPIITNDLGYAYFYCPTTREPGYVFPLGPKTALGVVPGDANVVAEGRWPGSWETPIYHHELEPNAQGGLNKALAQAAQDFIFGPTVESVNRWRSVMSEPGQLPFPAFLARFSSKTRRENEFLWHRLVSSLVFRPGDSRVGEFRLTPASLAGGWAPAIILPTQQRSEPKSLFYIPPSHSRSYA